MLALLQVEEQMKANEEERQSSETERAELRNQLQLSDTEVISHTKKMLNCCRNGQ